jgi:hypothetical protein
LNCLAVVGNKFGAPLPLTLQFPDNSGTCVNLSSVNGYFTSDSACGILPVVYHAPGTLFQNAPNPFSDETAIAFELPADDQVSLVIHDQLGRQVFSVASGAMGAGHHVMIISGKTLPPGIYSYTVIGSSLHLSRQMLLLR